MTHASLFSGIGGFDLAAEWMGWENIFHCEWNPFGQKVLAHHFPNSKSYNDITKTDFTIHEGTIDVLSGGFPCQPYSSAGKRLGKEDERHLFPEMLRTIKEVKPTWVVGENVLGIVNWGGGWYSKKCKLTWKIRGTKYKRIYFQLVARTHHTKENELGLLPTPLASEGTKLTSSPTENQMSLTKLARQGMLPTPTATDFKGAYSKNAMISKGGINRSSMLRNIYIHTNQGWKQKDGKTSQLNPLFVEEMMGFPKNWTILPFQNGKTNQLKHTEMQ